MATGLYNEFSGRVAVVTGAAQGIGKAVADHLHALGATVVALDIQQSLSKNYTTLQLDVSDTTAVEKNLEYIERNIGAIDYLVYAAGILRMGRLNELSTGDWHDTFSVNTVGAFNVFTKCAQYMQDRKRGAMVLIGSNASSTPRINMGAYAASKAASTMMVKCLGLEMAKHNVRCNIVAPGSTDTAMQRQLWKDNNDIQRVIRGDKKNYRLGIPLQRIAQPDHIAKSVIYLLSEQSSHITMEVLRVDGGATLGSQ